MEVFIKEQANNTILDDLFENHTCAIFDMDGTLLDSMTIWSVIDQLFFAKHNCTLDPEFQQFVATLTLDESSVYMCEHYNLSITPEQVKKEFLDILDDYYRYKLPLKDGALDLLKHLRENGIKIMVATANEYDISYAALERTGVLRYADGLVTCSMVNASKNSPAVYLFACEKMGEQVSDCIVFEDSYHAMQTANDAGFDVVAVYDDEAKNVWDDICQITKCQVVF